MLIVCSGAKGVLTDWPGRVEPREIKLRPSLVKFESNLKDLNVVRVSWRPLLVERKLIDQIAKYQGASLNRQFINIMAANGIPEQLFIQLFTDKVNGIKGLADRVKARRWNDDDIKLISTCSDVRCLDVHLFEKRVTLTAAVPSCTSDPFWIPSESVDPGYG